VKVTVHPEYPEWAFNMERKGYDKLRDGIKGLAKDKLSQNQAMQKCMACVDFTGSLSNKKAEKIAKMVWNWTK